MKKKTVFLTAVLLITVLLFFLSKKGFFEKGKDPSVTPGPELLLPRLLQNVWILSSEERSITFFYEGEEWTVATKGVVQDALQDCVGDVTIQGEEVVSLVLKPDKVSAKVLRVDKNGMELEGYGELSLADGFRVYRLYDGVAEEPSGKVLVGSAGNEFILENGKICAALLTKAPDTEHIRVLIGTEGYRGYYHEEVAVTSDCSFTVSWGEEEKKYEAGEVCTFTEKTFDKDTERRIIAPEQPDGKLTVSNLKRAEETPSYRGTLEIEGRKEGLLLVNEVTMEEYLYAVLPSEMPSAFGAEALKAQAICARSYAYTGLLANRYAEYGAHVDDSVSCQVYNNIAETEESILAVKETHGQVLFYEGEVAQCYYFSTSSGHTTAAEDVWEYAKEIPYLQGKETPYDEVSPWYRWQTFLPLGTLTERVTKALQTRYAVVPEQILTYVPEEEAFLSKAIDTVGTVEQVQVRERGAGDIATELLVVGSEGVFLVKNEYNIRTVLAPLAELIYRENGEAVEGAALLPSAFVTLQKGTHEEAIGYLISGGGYGHGVGMSQCGADAMARAGYSCDEIIEEYYPGTELGFIYD